jgi:hypothetical protein
MATGVVLRPLMGSSLLSVVRSAVRLDDEEDGGSHAGLPPERAVDLSCRACCARLRRWAQGPRVGRLGRPPTNHLSHGIGRDRVGRDRPCPSQLLAQVGHLLAKGVDIVALGMPISWHV